MGISLIDLTRSNKEQTIALYGVPDKKEVTIGRHVDGHFENDIKIPHSPLSKHVSKEQCLLQIEEDGIYIRDQNSTHGTYVDGKKLGAGERRQIRNGSIIKLGPHYELEVSIGDEPETMKIVE